MTIIHVVSLQRQLYEYGYNNDDAVQQTDDAYNNANNYDDDAVAASNNDDDGSSSTSNSNSSTASSSSSIRATNCISFTVEPKQDKFNALLKQKQSSDSTTSSTITTSFIGEESFIFYSHRTYGTSNTNENDDGNNGDYSRQYNNYGGSPQNLGSSYMVNVQDFVAAFGGVACQQLDPNDYSGVLLNENSASSSVSSLYWGPICNHGSFGITMGVFLDEDCAVYAPELSQTWQSYLYSNGENENDNGNDDNADGNDNANADLLQEAYTITSLNAYYQNEFSCMDQNYNNNNNDDESGTANVCSAIFENSVDEETCEPMDDSSSVFSLSSIGNWFQYSDPHNYYHLTQYELQDMTSTCNAINTALQSSSYTFEDFLQTLEANNGNTAAALEYYKQDDVLTPAERILTIIGAAILALIGVYCCGNTLRRMNRAHMRSMRRRHRKYAAGNSKLSLIEFTRTVTAASSDSVSTTDKREPLVEQDESTADITDSSTKYPASASSYTFQPRMARDGSLVRQQNRERLKVVAVAPSMSKDEESMSSHPTENTNVLGRLNPLKGLFKNKKDDVFDGITIQESYDRDDDVFDGIEDKTGGGNDSVFDGVENK